MMGSWGLISDVDHKALWGFPTYVIVLGNTRQLGRTRYPIPYRVGSSMFEAFASRSPQSDIPMVNRFEKVFATSAMYGEN